MGEAEEAFFDTTCPHCKRALSFPESEAGAIQECPWCGGVVIVPAGKADVAGVLPLPVVTARLQLRVLAAADAPPLAAVFDDPDLFRYWDSGALSQPEIEQSIEGEWSNRLSQAAGSLGLAIDLNGTAIGVAWFSLYDKTRRQASVQMVIGAASQRRGFGTEALRGLLSFAFRGLLLHRVVVACDSRNAAVCRMADKTGMRREGQFLQDDSVRGAWVDTTSYAMLRDEFEHPPRRTEAARP